MNLFAVVFSLQLISSAFGLIMAKRAPPVVSLDYGTFQGTTSSNVDSFLGMPFAQARRFGLPQSPSTFTTTQLATAYGPACPQQPFELNIPNNNNMTPTKRQTLEESEDCLFVNVLRPAGTTTNAGLPVLFWIFGGGWEVGDTSSYDGTTLVSRSIELGEPVIYVSANYRLNAFGFLASSEVSAEGLGNLGIRDQRFAMQWVQSNIASFGGDPTKVTIYGQSAGAVSVGLHLVINNGNPGGLFRAAIMESGGPIPLTSLDSGQQYYDQLVQTTGCSTANDTLACLSNIPYTTLYNAIQLTPSVASYLSLNIAWRPRVDGEFITQDPMISISEGSYARVPFIAGNVDDEGTYFSLTNQNVTTDDEAMDYIHTNYLTTSESFLLDPVAELYSSMPAEGSPFNTGDSCTLTPQYKRLAAFQGDYLLHGPRRYFMQLSAETQNTWGYLYRRGKNSSCLGSAHGTDVPEFYGSSSGTNDYQGTDAIVNFVNNLDPNTVGNNSKISSLISWPKYSSNLAQPPLLAFVDPNELEVVDDTYRSAGIEYLATLFPHYSV